MSDTPSKHTKQRNSPVVILTVLLLCSAFLNIALARRTKNLDDTILYMKAEMTNLRGLSPDGKAPPIQAKDISGKLVTLSFFESGLPTIVYVFAPNCLWCTRNLDNIEALSVGTKGKYRLIGLSLSSEGLKEYISQNKLDFPIYTDLTNETYLAYKSGTPRTLIISPDGMIIRSWFGAYTGELRKEVEEYFKTTLPGIVEQGIEDKEMDKKACETCD